MQGLAKLFSLSIKNEQTDFKTLKNVSQNFKNALF